MSEDELMKLIRKTILDWAMEEHLSNQDIGSSLSLHERYEENALTFMQRARMELEEDLARLQELPV